MVVGLDFGEIVREPRFVIGHWEGCECAFICGGMLLLHVFNCHDYSIAMTRPLVLVALLETTSIVLPLLSTTRASDVLETVPENGLQVGYDDQRHPNLIAPRASPTLVLPQ